MREAVAAAASAIARASSSGAQIKVDEEGSQGLLLVLFHVITEAAWPHSASVAGAAGAVVRAGDTSRAEAHRPAPGLCVCHTLHCCQLSLFGRES